MNYMSRVGITYVKICNQDIINKVCEHFDINEEQLKSKRRNRELVDARGIIMYLLHKYKGQTSTSVAKLFGKNHATVLHQSRKIEGYMDVDREFFELVNSFK